MKRAAAASRRSLRLAAGVAACALLACGRAAAADLSACHLPGIDREVRCGSIEVAENPDAPAGRRIAIHFAVVPALARNKAPDPVFVFAGGPGQSATRVARQLQAVFAQVNARRDIVYVDQRGTGRSNPLRCDRGPRLPTLAESVDAKQAQARLAECLRKLRSDGHDLSQYASWIALRDVDAVRAALGYERINLWGGSYGTRAALEYLRQFPQHVRSAVLDGAAPADMVLPASFAVDSESALARLLDACAAEPACRARHPRLAADIDRLLAQAGGGQRVVTTHPLTGRAEPFVLDRPLLASLLRAPLYAPQLAAVLPHALASAGGGDYAALVALALSLAGSIEDGLAEGMHYAVICAEDVPRVDAAAVAAAHATRFGTVFIDVYRETCRDVPVRAVPPAFFSLPRHDVPVLILSGGADPATPPRHGERIAAALPRARHLVAPNLGHGITAQGCAPELITRFFRQGDFEGIDGACLARLPAPTFFRPIEATP
jgi:pimeloyl-ACP methyl ester carboxylesterase